MATMDWVKWHADYDRADSALARRLGIVQQEIRSAVENLPPGPINAVSMCAGDGRDLIGSLDGHARAKDLRARLVELDPSLAERARDSAAAAGLTGVEVVTGDAGVSDAYDGATPADLVLVMGVLGNVTDDDVLGVVRALSQFCATGATVLMSRHSKDPALIATLRGEMRASGFREDAFHEPDGTWITVSRWSWPGESGVLIPGVKLFEFVADEEQSRQ